MGGWNPSKGGVFKYLIDPMTTVGDIIIRDAINATTRLGIGTIGQVLTVSPAGIPAWTDPSVPPLPLTTVGDILIRDATNTNARLPIGTAKQVLNVSATGIPAWTDPALWGNTLGWGYQDFPAASGPSLTLTANENGTVTFNAAQIISNSAQIVLTSDPESFPYTGTTKLFSTKVIVNSQTGTAVVLNAVPNASWGQVRVYYMYNYGASLPDGYTLAPEFINSQELTEIQALFVTKEQLQVVIPYTTLGDLVYGGAILGQNTRLPVGLNGQFLSVVSGVPAWVNDPVSQYVHDFVIGDWVGPIAGYYHLQVNHNLNLSMVDVEVWDGSDQPIVLDRTLTSTTIATLSVPSDPDLRFAGLVWVKSI